MWLLGGWNPHDAVNFPKDSNNEVWSSRDGALWTLVKPNTFGIDAFDRNVDWEGRHTAGYVVFKDRMWIIGGDVIQRRYHYDVWNSADGERWTRVGKGRFVPWGPRALHYTVVFDNHIWVIGGQTVPQLAPENEVFYDDVWKSPDGIQWHRVPVEGPRWASRGMIGGSAVFKGRIWILGGGTLNALIQRRRNMYNDVWSSADGVHWKRHVAHAPWKPRQYHEVAVFDDRLWVLEGWNEKNLNDVWHSADGVNWYELPGTPWAPRHAASVFVFNDALWVVAGNNMQSDVWRLTRTRTGNDQPG
jgi:hypothetical protein